MKHRRSVRHISHKLLLLGGLLIAIAGASAYYYLNRDASNQPYPNNTADINLNPPTDEEAQAGDAVKDDLDKNDATTEQAENNAQTKTASVIITDAGQYDDVIEVRSFISNSYQDGTCTITLSQGTKKVSKETAAYSDASTTICTNPLFKRSEFTSGGQWQVVVSYKATGISGQSEPLSITIN